jgi:DNA-binding response OmpR family regulator
MAAVLVVDDAPYIRDLLKAVLVEWGFEVLLAGNVAVARDLSQSYSIELALVDCVLPTASGFSLASHLKSHGVPVILMSGDGNSMRQLPAVGTPYLFKPFHLAELRSMIDELLRPANQDGPPAAPALS